jgi:hypothetical protein
MKRYKHKLPMIDGQIVVIEIRKLNEALELMWNNKIEPEEIDQYLVADWN